MGDALKLHWTMWKSGELLMQIEEVYTSDGGEVDDAGDVSDVVERYYWKTDW